MTPIYLELTFGINDNINSIVEESLERLKKRINMSIKWIKRLRAKRFHKIYNSNPSS